MLIEMIVAYTKTGRYIGKNNDLLFKLRCDLKHFRQKTWDKPILMGRKTYESIEKHLEGRLPVVISRDANYNVIDGLLYTNVIDAIKDLELKYGYDCCICIGGGEIYREILPYTDVVYATEIAEYKKGDTTFPMLDNSFVEIGMAVPYNKNQNNESAFFIRTYERINLYTNADSEDFAG